jgi:hypothetical protein
MLAAFGPLRVELLLADASDRPLPVSFTRLEKKRVPLREMI